MDGCGGRRASVGAVVDWAAAADAGIRAWHETGMGTYGAWGALALTVAVLAWKFMDAWGKRREK